MESTVSLTAAIDAGHTHCGQRGEPECLLLADLSAERAKSGTYFLCDQPAPYQIGATLINRLLNDWLDEQDEVADENGDLSMLVSKIDYAPITRAINDALSATKWFPLTDTRIVQP